MKKQKIIISTLDASIMGGVEKVVCNLSALFIKNGHSVEVISFFKKNEEEFFNFGDISVKYLSERECNNGLISKIRTFFLTFRLLDEFCQKNDETILISTYPRTTVFLSFLSRKMRNRIIAHEHSAYDAHSSLVKFLRLLTYRKLKKVVTLTQHDKRKFEKGLIPTVVIPNFIEGQPTSRYREKNDSLICLSAGRLHKDKGFDRLLEITKHFKDKNIEFYIVGSGSEEEALKGLISEYGMGSQISLMPAMKNLNALMEKCHVYLLTSRTEAFPLVIIEALALSKPIIAFDCPIGPREIINNSKNGFLVRDGDIFAYVSKIEEIMESERLYKKLSKGAFESFKNYTPEKNYHMWSEILT